MHEYILGVYSDKYYVIDGWMDGSRLLNASRRCHSSILVTLQSGFLFVLMIRTLLCKLTTTLQVGMNTDAKKQ